MNSTETNFAAAKSIKKHYEYWSTQFVADSSQNSNRIGCPYSHPANSHIISSGTVVSHIRDFSKLNFPYHRF